MRSIAQMGVTLNKKPKQIAAWVCIILLLLLYIVTFIAAIFDSSESGVLFRTCLMATIILPILLWIYIWLYGKMKDKHTIASLDIMQTGEKEDKEN